MRILVTGGSGFIGTNLINKIYKKHDVYVVDNESSGNIHKNKCVKYYKVDLIDIKGDEHYFKDVDLIIHLAASGNVVESVSNPRQNFMNNVLGLFNILEAARLNGINKIIFASTGGALIGDAELPVNENSTPKPISPYGASKLAGENYLHTYGRAYGISTIALRFANVYGPISGHKKGAVTKFINQAVKNQDIVIYGDGTSTRDYLFVDDLCEAIISSINYDTQINESMHISSSIETSILSLANMILRLTDSSSAIKFMDERSGEVKNNFSTNVLSKKYLDFQPKTLLEDGLNKTLSWFHKFQ